MTDKAARSAAAKQAWARRKAHQEGAHAGAPLEECKLCVQEALALLAAKTQPEAPQEALAVVEAPTNTADDVTVEVQLADSVTVEEEPVVETKKVTGVTASQTVAGEQVLIPDPDPNTLIGELKVYHFVADGFTKWGKVWFRGDELKLDTGSERYKKTIMADGRSMFDLTAAEQEQRWGEELFRPGEWPGIRIDWTEEEYMKALSENDRTAIERMEQGVDRSKAPLH